MDEIRPTDATERGTAAAATLLNRGRAAVRAGRWHEAAELARAELVRQPNDAAALHLLGLALLAGGELGAAADALRRAVAALNGSPIAAARARADLAAALGRGGDHAAARGELLRAVADDPGYADAWRNLGVACERLGRDAEAEDAYRRAVALAPKDAAGHAALGAFLSRRGGREAEAEAALRQAIRCQPTGATAASAGEVMADLLANQARVPEAIRCRRAVAALRPSSPAAGRALVATMLYDSSYSAADHLAAARAWAARFAPASLATTLPAPPKVGEATRLVRLRLRLRLRVGFLSGHPTAHPEGRFLAAVLPNLDRAAFEVFVYSNTARPDAVTTAIRAACDRFVDVRPLDDEAAAATIRRDGIDVLIDLSGHFANGRLAVLAGRPARVQAICGYPATSGMDAAVDWRITDAWADPVEQTPERQRPPHASERVIRLPRLAWCQAPPTDVPALDPGPPPMVRTGCATFISANSAMKTSAASIELWAAVLRATPGARLKLLAGAHALSANDTSASAAACAFLRARFPAAGIGPERLLFSARLSRGDYFRWLADADVALDPTPYNGNTTTIDLLWSGVPVVTLAGDHAMARQGAAILHAVELPGMIAKTPSEYFAIAHALASDPARLRALRGGLRRRVTASMVCDCAGFAGAMGDVLKRLAADGSE